MKLKAITGISLTVLLIGTLTFAFNTQQAESLEHTHAHTAIFTSGFETGDYSEWTETATEGGATIALVSDISHHGSYSSRATFTAPWQGAWSGIYGLSANPVYVRWYAMFDTLPGNGQAFTLIESIDSNGNSIWDLDIWRGEGGTLGLWFYRTRPSIGDHYYSYNFEVDTWYCFEVKFYLHASAGEYRVYLNGVEVIVLTGMDTSGSAWMGIKLGRGSGFLSSLTTWTDCVKVADSYIGPEAAPVGGVWVPIDKFGLLAPYIGLATIILAIVATAVFVKCKKRTWKTEMTDENTHRLIALMRSFEYWSKRPHYNMWGKSTGYYHNFKIQELNYITEECPPAFQSSALALDAGCGVGVYSSMLTHKGYHVIGLDVSSGMLEKARSLFDGDNISFVRGSITNLPFRRSKFDVILCVDTLHHLTNSHFTQTLNEFARVIRPHGLLVSDTRNALNPLLWIRCRLKNRKWAERGGLTLVPRTLKHIEKRLKEHGFEPVKVERIGNSRINRLVGLIAPYIVVIARAYGMSGR